MQIRSGTKFVYELKAGEHWGAMNDGRLIITHPDRAPKIVNDDGSEEPLELTSDGPATAFTHWDPVRANGL